MNAQETELAQIDISIEQAVEMIDTADALRRLHDNKDFHRVIVKGYFKEEAARAVLLRADPEMGSEQAQKEVNDVITSIGGLFAYFHKTYAVANQARMSMAEDEETRGEILAEQLGEETIQ